MFSFTDNALKLTYGNIAALSSLRLISMISESDIVKIVVRHGIVFFQNIFSYWKKCLHLSFCTSRFGLELQDICCIDKHLIRSYVEAEYSNNWTHSEIWPLEMLFIKFNYHSLSMFSRTEINEAIQCLSTV